MKEETSYSIVDIDRLSIYLCRGRALQELLPALFLARMVEFIMYVYIVI